MISNSQILCFIATFAIWTILRKYLLTVSEFPKIVNNGESLPSVTHFSPSKTVNLLNGIEKIGNETESLNRAYKLLSFIAFHTKSSKSRIEYDRAIGYFKKFIFRNDPPPKVFFEKPEKIRELKVNEICPEVHWSGKDLSVEYNGPLWIHPFLKSDCKVPPLDSLVTLLFNFVNEIHLSKAEELFLDVAVSECKKMNMIAVVNKQSSYTHLTKIAGDKLPNMKIIESSRTKHVDVLRETMDKVTTKYVVITRNIERFDNFSLIIRLVRDISLGNAEIVGGTQRNQSGHWKAGCYQVKKENDLLHFEEGYDESDNGCMYCDYLSTPFAVKTENLKMYLQHDSMKSNDLTGDFLYMEYFMTIRFKDKLDIFMCADAMFYTETSALQTTNNNNEWLPYLKKYKYSTVTIGFPDQKNKIEYSCKDVAITCSPSISQGMNTCCMKEGELHIKHVMEMLSQSNLEYRFQLPTSEPYWDTIDQLGISSGKFIISVQVADGLDKLKNILKFDGFEWKGSKFTSVSWLFDFVTTPSLLLNKNLESRYTISFGDLHLPVVGFPGDSLVLNTTCIPCLDLLFNYRDMKSHKIWL